MKKLEKINRRKAIQKASTVLGGAMSTSLVMGIMSGCAEDVSLEWSPQALSSHEAIITAALADLILPATSTPGAKDAQVERFVDRMVAGFLTESERDEFKRGLTLLHRRRFAKKTSEEQRIMLTELATEAKKQDPTTETKPFFLLAKEMIVLGFFTSEIGATQVLNYDAIPGGYQGCMLLDKVGGKTWAT